MKDTKKSSQDGEENENQEAPKELIITNQL